MAEDSKATAQDTTTQASSKLVTYKVVYPLHHNGKLYDSGKPVKLAPEDAAPLVLSGVLKGDD